jgi:DEAD/DEAH box helicase domain-containing protein
MNNAFEIWRELREIYLKYIDTGLPIKYRELEVERRQLLRGSESICKSPIIELVPRYKEYCTLSEACSKLLLNSEFSDFANAGLFPPRDGIESKIYNHQFEALEKAIKERKHIIITTGTGSGKTECFLFPMLYDILNEKGAKPSEDSHAVRGLILYPLNALAEDQIRRLRKALSSDTAIKYLDDYLNGKRISFGRYTGITPYSGKETNAKRSKLQNEKEQMVKDWKSAIQQASRTKDLEYLFDVCNMNEGVNSEFWDRWTMQKTPPDILITNYSMLNIMLMRKHEASIFEKTRDWLKADKSHIFHLVIDELHSYRGTSGTEVAYLIRLLLMRLGLTPDSPQVQFLCSSASMNETERTKKFIAGFFGLHFSQYHEKFSIIKDEILENGNNNNGYLAIEKYASINENSTSTDVNDLFAKDEILDRLKTVIHRAEESEKIALSLFGELSEKSMIALEGLLIGLGKLVNEKNDSIQPQRAHYFFRNIEGLWACTNPLCNQVDDNHKYPNRAIGKLYKKPQVSCKCGCVILEVLLCRQCGELYLGGWESTGKNDKVVSIEREAFKPAERYITIYPVLDEIRDNWQKCSFNPQDGSFKRTRLGDALYFAAPADYQVQYPNHCYNCDFTETIRNSGTLTPIFKHYTGVQKVNQLMADSLMVSLKKFSKTGEKPKLVLFSDSRQAAAKLAAGIEMDHYRDSLRASLLNNLESKTDDKLLLRKYFDKIQLTETEKLKFKELRNSNEYTEILNKINDYLQFGEKQNEIIEYFNSGSKVRLDRVENAIMNELFDAGINPGGSAPSINENWNKNYDFDSKNFSLKNLDIHATNLHGRILNSFKKEILITIFAHNKRSLESLIQGKIVAGNRHNDVQMNQFINSAIRLLGESWRIEGAFVNNASSFPAKLWKYARKVWNFNGWNFPPNIRNEFLDFLVDNRIIANRQTIILTGNGLMFIPATIGEKVWRCQICGTPHLHQSADYCIGCNSRLSSPQVLTKDQIENDSNYYIYLAKLARENKPSRLHCEELSGQTDKNDARKRQRLFQSRFLDGEIPKTEEIDLLSVTTTMEAGVDIGSLSAVMMGNVPPQRFNYQQRVGRAGRRGKPLSVALTIAKGNSHDQTHYVQSHRMVSSIPPDPYLELNREEIFYRVFYKEILNRAFSIIDIEGDDLTDSVHGEFGKYYNWRNYRGSIQDWINANELVVIEIAEHLKQGTYIVNSNEVLYRKIKKNLIDDIDKIVDNEFEYTQIALSERLANAGFLPMFGFPSKVRVLYESFPNKLPPENVVDRNLDLAISEFAPGSEIVKDKKILTPVGVVHYKPKVGGIEEVDGRSVLPNGISRCTNCSTVFLEVQENNSCSICGNSLEIIQACSPLGFCVDYDLAIPKDFDGSFEWSPRAGEVTLDPNSKLVHEVPLGNIYLRSNQVPAQGIVHQINDNDGNLFQLGKLPGKFENRWVVQDLLLNQSIRLKNVTGYAFLSSRHTGVITVSIQKLASEYHLDAYDPYHKAAFLSWAFLLRKSICDELDIETNEFDVGYRVSPNSNNPEIYIVEKADNGAGYCNYLNGIENKAISEKVFVKSLLPDGRVFKEILMRKEHENVCNSSCYDCLRDYYNQKNHSLLNWRIALDLASLANNSEVELNFQQEYWRTFMNETLLTTLENKLSGQRRIISNNSFIETDDRIYLISHPFWNGLKIQSIKNEFTKEIITLNVMDAIAKTKF